MANPQNPKSSAKAQAKAATAAAAKVEGNVAKGMQPKSAAVEERSQQFNEDMERLRLSYEQYFLGRERVPPTNLRKHIDRTLNDLLNSLPQVHNTSLKFRIKGQQSKLIALRRYWDRTLQEIEDGIYRRDRFKMKIHEREAEEARKKEGAKSGKSDAAQKAADAAAPAAEAAAKRNNAVETLMNQFVDAKKKCNEGTANVSYDAFAKTIATQSAAIKKQYNCKSVRFKVVIENGKTKLKATPV